MLNAIAKSVGKASTSIKTLSDDNISEASEPTSAMKNYVANDKHKIISKLADLTVGESGYYVVKVTLPAAFYAQNKDRNISELKVYALSDNDSQIAAAAVASSGTWEILNTSGAKMQTLNRDTVLLTGNLNQGTSTSLYLAEKSEDESGASISGGSGGGCNSYFGNAYLILALFGFAAIKFFALHHE